MMGLFGRFFEFKSSGQHTPLTIMRRDFYPDRLLRQQGDNLTGCGVKC
jgi:hypothetical protein